MLSQGRDLHIDAVLSNIMVGRKPVGFVADQLVPIVNVGKQSNVYFKSQYKEQLMHQVNLTTRAKGAESREVYFTVSSDTYYAKNYALGTRWFQEDVVNADDPIRLRERSATLVTNRLLVDYEYRVAALAGVAANISTLTHVATAWSNTTGSRIVDDVATQLEAFRTQNTVKANVMVIPEEVATYVRRNDQVRDFLFGDRGGIASEQQLASLFNVERVLVPSARVNTFGPGESMVGTVAHAAVWPSKVFFAHVGALNGDQVDTWISAFRWTDPSFGVPWAIRAFDYDSKTRSQKIEAQYYQDEKIVSAELCFGIDSVI